LIFEYPIVFPIDEMLPVHSDVARHGFLAMVVRWERRKVENPAKEFRLAEPPGPARFAKA
jgi:hypothetical protein